MTALFERRDEGFIPMEAADSPWHPELLHGGSVAALKGVVIQHWSRHWDGFLVQRMSLDLLRPVPRACCRNADITLALSRYPESEWLCIDAEAIMRDSGLGVLHSRVHDTRDEIGHVQQTTQVNPEYSGS